MKRKDGGTTSPLLLNRVTDWADQRAWSDFFRNYDPLIRCWCGDYRLDDAIVEELCQQIWIELADRMRTYQYDPGKTFRGWLRRLCHCRAVDLLRRRRRERDRLPADQSADQLLLAVDHSGRSADEEPRSRRSLLLSQAEQVQHAVKERVEPQTWHAFWQIAVGGCSFRETADDMGMSYAAVFAAHKRVGRMLRAEGKVRLTQQCPDGPEANAPAMS
jgi:RNA polymerase sigma factor (sigma-70 family)